MKLLLGKRRGVKTANKTMSKEKQKEKEDKPPDVHKVIGAPGTGKTTNVVGNPELDLDGKFLKHLSYHPSDDGNFDIDEIILITYTKAGVEEAAERLGKMLNGKDGRPDIPKYKIEEQVTTIHSLCWSLLNDDPRFDGLEREQVVKSWNKKKFCDRKGLEFGWDDDDDEMMGNDLEEGNALFKIYDWLQANRVPIERAEECPVEWEGEDNIITLLNEWEQYKEEKNLVGFGDMITETIKLGREQLENLGYGELFPDKDTTTKELLQKAREDPIRDPDVLRGSGMFADMKVMFVDEVQDLTRAQWELYMLQKLVADKVFLGGDDDQTIYGWAGADPELMLGEEGDFEVLEKTYRIPANIWEQCNTVIQQVDVRQEKEVQPHGDGGEFVPIINPSKRNLTNQLKTGEWFVLFRARYQIDEFRDTLHKRGIPYRNMSTFDTWSDDVTKIRDGLANIKQGNKVKGDELDVLMEYAEDHMIKEEPDVSGGEKVMAMFGGIERERLDEIFEIQAGYGSTDITAENYLQGTEELNHYEKEAIKGSINNETWDLYPHRVKIGTIHSAKGKEAPNVLLATDSTQTILDNMREEAFGDAEEARLHGKTPVSDAERRVYYVGMSRASEKLVLAEGVFDPAMSIGIDSLISKEVAEEAKKKNKYRGQSSW